MGQFRVTFGGSGNHFLFFGIFNGSINQVDFLCRLGYVSMAVDFRVRVSDLCGSKILWLSKLHGSNRMYLFFVSIYVSKSVKVKKKKKSCSFPNSGLHVTEHKGFV